MSEQKEKKVKGKNGRWLIAGGIAIIALISIFAGYFLYLENNLNQVATGKLESGAYQEAIQQYEQQLALQPDFLQQKEIEAISGRAEAHFGDGNYQAAIDDWTKLIELDSGRTDLFEKRGEAYLLLEEWSAAIVDLTTVLDKEPERIDLLADRGRAYFASGDLIAGRADYERLLAIEPNDLEIQKKLFELDFLAEDREKVLQRAAVILDINEQEATAYLYPAFFHLAAYEDQIAFEELTNFLDLEQDQAIPYALRGWLYLIRGEFDFAEADAQQALRLDPDSALGKAVLGAVLAIDRNDLEGGIALLNEAVSYSPELIGRARALQLRAIVYENERLWEAALSDINEGIAIASDQAWLYQTRGDIQLAHGRLAEAQLDYQEAVNLAPNSFYVYIGRANGSIANGLLKEAETDLVKLLREDPSFVAALLLQAKLAIIQEDEEQALKLWDQVVGLDTDVPQLYQERADYYLSRAAYSEAVEDYNWLLARNPIDYQALVGRGYALAALNQYEEAVVDLSAAVALSESADEQLYLERAKVYQELGVFEAAVADARTALRLNRNLAYAQFIVGFYEMEQENYFQAIVEFSNAIKLEPELAEAFAYRGRAHILLGDIDRARADANRAIGFNPELMVAYLVRADIHAYDGKWVDAIEDADFAVELERDAIEPLRVRGLIYLDAGDAHAALDDFQKIVGLDQTDVSGHRLSAQALDGLGRYEDAIKSLELILQLEDIDVTDIEVSESTIADLQRIPSVVDGFRLWEDPVHQFSIQYPDGWRQYVDPGETTPLYLLGPLDKDYRANLMLLILDESSLTLSQISRLFKVSGADLDSSRSIRVAGRSAIREQFSWTTTDSRLRDVEVSMVRVYLVNRGKTYIFTMLMRAEDVEKYIPVFDEMINQFEIK